MTDGISFVICTYNGAARLPSALEHLARQEDIEGIPIEVLVVDNASSDGSAAVAEAAWAELAPAFPLRVITEPRRGVMHARYTGMASAAFAFLCFVDDDNHVAPGWAALIYRRMRAEPRLGALSARGVAETTVPLPVWFDRLQYAYGVGPHRRTSRHGRPMQAYSAGLTIRGAAVRQVQALGFEPLLVGRVGTALTAGEDTELCYALQMAGWDLGYDEALIFRHCIAERRLTRDYVVGLYRGFGNAAAKQDLYFWVALWPRTDPLLTTLLMGPVTVLSSLQKAISWGLKWLRGPKYGGGDPVVAECHARFFLNRLISHLTHLHQAPSDARRIIKVFGPSLQARAT